jgi:hypothetical protein
VGPRSRPSLGYGYLQARGEPPSMLGSGLASGPIDVIKCFQERLLCKACLGLFKHFQRWNIFSGKDLGPAVARFSFEKCDGRH